MSLKKNMEMNDNIRFISGLDKSVYKHASNILTKYNSQNDFNEDQPSKHIVFDY